MPAITVNMIRSTTTLPVIAAVVMPYDFSIRIIVIARPRVHSLKVEWTFSRIPRVEKGIVFKKGIGAVIADPMPARHRAYRLIKANMGDIPP